MGDDYIVSKIPDWDENEEWSSICKFLESIHPEARHNLLIHALLDIRRMLHYLRSGTITVDMVAEILSSYGTLGKGIIDETAQ